MSIMNLFKPLRAKQTPAPGMKEREIAEGVRRPTGKIRASAFYRAHLARTDGCVFLSKRVIWSSWLLPQRCPAQDKSLPLYQVNLEGIG